MRFRTSRRAMTFLRFLRTLLAVALLLSAGLVLVTLVSAEEPKRPASTLEVSPGAAPAVCTGGLRDAGVAYAALPARRDGDTCGYADAVRWAGAGSREISYAPAAPVLSCPLAAELAAWEWDTVQPAAARIFGSTVTRIDHFGSYACRRLYGRAAGRWSEHARAAAFDVAGFRLADGRRITVAGDWSGGGPEAAFLRAVRDGACAAFTTTLSPDYNAAHRDHLHLDTAPRGGWRACR